VRVPSPAGIGPRLNLFVRVLPALPALLLAGTARAWDPFDDAESPSHFELVDGDMKLALKGELSLTFHDLEGEGGPGNDSNTDTRTIGTRSPFIELSGFTLAPRLTLTPGLSVNTELRFTPEDAQVAATWFDGRAETGDFEHHVEIGFRPPLANRDPHATREPLAATAWWSAPEMHAAYEAGQKFGEDDDFAWSAGVSAAMGRPLGFAPVQASHAQRGTINLLAYDAGRVYSGNAPMYGARARFQAFGAYVEAFGFLGELADESGTDQLRASLAGYPSLPDGEQSNHTSRWGGGRVGYDGHGAHVVVEGVYGAEGALRRYAADAELAWRFDLHDGDWFTAVEPIVRADVYRILDSTRVHGGQALRSPALSQAATWDWTLYTAGVAVPVFRDLLRLRLEYDVVTEANDVPALNESGLDFRNDELRAELRLRF
jgi:hypothetical protein